MYQTITKSGFCNEFVLCGRAEKFSYEARKALFDYFEELEDETGEKIELDVIAICCDFSEESPEGIANKYSIEIDEDTPEDERGDALEEAVLRYLLNQGACVAGPLANGCFVYAAH